MTDAEGLTTTYTYDALGRVIAETKSGGGVRPDTTTTTIYDPEDRVLSRTVTSGDLSETETYAYDALGRTVSAIDSSGIETRYLYATDSTAGLETRTTIRAFGTDCAVTNTTISYADGRTKETLLNGIVKTAYEYGPNWTKTYEGPAGLDSPRWSCSYEDALGRTVATTDAAGIETRYLYATDATAGLETRTTIRAFGTDCAVTNTVVSYADGRTKETLLNGVVKTAYEYGPNWTKTYEGPAGLDSPRWSCSYEDALGRTICETRPGFRGALLVTSNEYNTANQLVATRS